MVTQINYVTGDATDPRANGHKIIVHCVNNLGLWGAGFVVALSKKWTKPEACYLRSFKDFELGQVQFVVVDDDITIANLFGQDGVRGGSKRPVRYDAISDGFDMISAWAANDNASVHMPRIGCGLAGGDWRIIEALVKESFTNQGVPVTVYDFQ